MPEPVQTFLSIRGLVSRGWTLPLIDALLSEPDLLTPYPPDPRRSLEGYQLERVEAAERFLKSVPTWGALQDAKRDVAKREKEITAMVAELNSGDAFARALATD